MKRILTFCIVAGTTVAIAAWAWKFLPIGTQVEESKPKVVAAYIPATPVVKDPLPVAAPQKIASPALPPDALDKIQPLLKAGRKGDRDAQFRIAKIMRSCPN